MPRSGAYEPWYLTSAMLGSNHRVRNTPVSSRTTKLHSAISPSMKDQWSGKTLRSDKPLVALARPSLSSAQVATAPARLAPLLGVAGSVPFVEATSALFIISH